MKITTKLLRQFGNISASDEEIITLIKEHIAEVESHHNIAKDYENIFVAEIVEKREHEDSDKLGIYQINIGEKENIQVVAGDRTLQVGDKVAYIKPSGVIPSTIYTEEEPIVIQSRKLGGEISNGMMCSERELNIGPEHNCVMRLPKDAPVGELFAKYYDLDDTVIDIENKGLTNRGDLFGIIGVARELTAITGNRFKSPEWFTNKDMSLTEEDTCLSIQVRNDAEALCPRYTAIALDSIQVKESPIWLKSVLVKCGVKPINNIVDITNYISLIFGQPMHAFDYDKVLANDPTTDSGVTINIRMAREGESILGLDNKVHKLSENNIVIADNSHPIAIAGIIGGTETEVDFSTKRIIFESANFDKNSIRKSSMELGIFTDSCTRYKHAIDAEMTLPALLKAVELAKSLSGGSIASEVIDNYMLPFDPYTSISLDVNVLNSHIGFNLSIETVKCILENLEYKVEEESKDKLIVNIPSWRRDIAFKEDLHEDIARVYGFNNIDLRLPEREIIPPRKNYLFDMKKEIRSILSLSGANELLTYSFTSLESFKMCNLNPDLAFKIRNALSPDLCLMRTTLLQSLLQKTKENLQRGFDKFALFEMNISHLKELIDSNNVPDEEWMLSMVITDVKRNQKSGSPYYIAKKYSDELLTFLGYTNIKYELIADVSEQSIPVRIKNLLGIFDPNTSAVLSIHGTYIGVIGEFKENVKSSFKLPYYSSGIELSVSQLVDIGRDTNTYKQIPVFPTFSVDLSIEVNNSVQYKDLLTEIQYVVQRSNLWSRIECIDIYKDEKMKEKKRITFRIVASDYDRTMNNSDIKKLVERITERLEKKFEAKII